jgi:demethylspheroidene O-methyltransferase
VTTPDTAIPYPPPDELEAGRTSWRDALARMRDGWLANPRFQRFAARFWLTRAVARRRARGLFDLCAGFVYSQVLLACVRLDLFEQLRAGPCTVHSLAARAALPDDSMLRLLEAATALGLVERRGRGRFGLGAHGAALLGNPAVVAMIEHHALLYADLADPVALLRAGKGEALARYWAYAGAERPATLGGEAVAAYTELMSSSQPLVAHDVLDAYPLGRHRCLLDVGGGDGTFLAAAAARAPQLQCVLFDLPPVAERARARFAAAGLGARARAVGGDFRADALPPGADVVSFVRVLHDHDDATVMHLLRAARAALPPDGTLLVAEPMADTRGAEPMGAAYFGFYLLAMGKGRPRTPQEYEAMLHRSGFDRVRSIATAQPLQTRLLCARAAASRANL